MHNFRELKVWQRSMDVVIDCYSLARQLPKEERFGLANQIRRSAASVPSNIAESTSWDTAKGHRRFLRIAYGSACELETQLLVAERLGWLAAEKTQDVVRDIDEIRAMLFRMTVSEPS